VAAVTAATAYIGKRSLVHRPPRIRSAGALPSAVPAIWTVRIERAKTTGAPAPPPRAHDVRVLLLR